MSIEAVMREHSLSDPWDVVDLFERRVADYAGSRFAVAVDSCTNALFLSLKFLGAEGEIEIPKRTYVSVPGSVIHAGCTVRFVDKEWKGSYALDPFPVWDSATRMRRGMYVHGSLYCLSFHRRKHVPIGKGGMILTDCVEARDWLKLARYEGRHLDVAYSSDSFDMVGWNMYMTPEQAAVGLDLFSQLDDVNEDLESSGSQLDLSQFPVFENANRSL